MRLRVARRLRRRRPGFWRSLAAPRRASASRSRSSSSASSRCSFDDRRRALQDFLAGTTVFYDEHAPLPAATRSPRRSPPRSRQLEPPEVRGLDPRLLRRARPARLLLRLDAALGVAMALLVLAPGGAARARRRALVRRRVARRRRAAARAARRRDRRACGAPPGASRSRAGAPRRACSRRCASTSSSSGCAPSRPRSTAPRAARSRPPRSPASTRSRRYFARYLPQLVLAAVVPVAVLILVASLDLLSAGVMLLTLPLVPLFMWLDRPARPSAARASAGRRCGCSRRHFLDVVRGLPTLRAFNRGEAQAAADRARSPTSTGARRWARCASRSSRAPCSSWRRRSGSRSSR